MLIQATAHLSSSVRNATVRGARHLLAHGSTQNAVANQKTVNMVDVMEGLSHDLTLTGALHGMEAHCGYGMCGLGLKTLRPERVPD